MKAALLLVGLLLVLGWIGVQQGWLSSERIKAALPAAAGLSSASEASARPVYEWKDAAGRRHFGDTPPPGVEARPSTLPGLTVVTMPKAAPAAEATADGKKPAPRLVDPGEPLPVRTPEE